MAILPPFALHHPNRHTRGIDVVDPQVKYFGEAQARSIRREEHGALPKSGRGADQPLDLVST
jgi:hypothetical protein